MHDAYDFAVIFPVYNPQKDWETTIFNCCQEIQSNFAHQKIIYIIVNDGSTTIENPKIFTENSKRYLLINHTSNQGKGAAIRTGMSHKYAAHYLYTDWDIPFGTKSLIRVMAKLKDENYDLVLSVRNKEYYKILPFKRRLISKIVTLLNYVLFNGRFVDSQAGLKGYSQKASDYLKNGKINGFLFEIEYLFNIRQTHLRFTQIEVGPKEGLKVNDLVVKTIFENLRDYIELLIKELRKK